MKQTKRQLIDNVLFLYGGIVSFALTGIALFNLNNLSSVITFILFLPVSIYFLLRLFVIISKTTNKLLNNNHHRHPYFGDFSILTFIKQSENSFMFNLFLLALSISLIFFRISLNNLK